MGGFWKKKNALVFRVQEEPFSLCALRFEIYGLWDVALHRKQVQVSSSSKSNYQKLETFGFLSLREHFFELRFLCM